MNEGEFKDKVVLITGAAGGIGRELCEEFAARGALVYKTDIVKLAEPHFIAGDISEPEFVRECVRFVLDDAGRIDILINNAGICLRTSLLDITVEEWRNVLDVNLTSTFLLSQLCLGKMIEQRSGSIVNLSSVAGKVGGIAVGAHYSASKAAISCLTKTFARYGAPYGVRVNAVAPGIIDTVITRAAGAEKIESLRQTIPLGRIGDAGEVAKPIIFLASDQASYITGVTLDINGGLLMD